MKGSLNVSLHPHWAYTEAKENAEELRQQVWSCGHERIQGTTISIGRGSIKNDTKLSLEYGSVWQVEGIGKALPGRRGKLNDSISQFFLDIFFVEGFPFRRQAGGHSIHSQGRLGKITDRPIFSSPEEGAFDPLLFRLPGWARDYGRLVGFRSDS
jgi:hypothetical protein